MAHPSRYRVDGEVGRFEFETFDVRDGQARVVFRGLDLLPKRTGKQWYQTIGFKEFAFLHGVLDRSYRKTGMAFNLQRRQLKCGTPLTTLRDAAEAEGAAVFAAIERETQQAFIEHGFTGEGQLLVSASRQPPTLSQRNCRRNSSNPAERTCNLLASQRQKKNGMSWSTGGSQALSALACVVLNDRTRKWLTEAKFTLTFNQAA